MGLREKGTALTHTPGRALVTRRFLSTMFRNSNRNYPIIDELVDGVPRFLFHEKKKSGTGKRVSFIIQSVMYKEKRTTV